MMANPYSNPANNYDAQGYIPASRLVVPEHSAKGSGMPFLV